MKKYSNLIPDIEKDVQLRERTHTKTGGKVQYMFYPHNVDELTKVVTTLKSDGVDFEVFGEMTNIAVTENDLDILIINMMRYEADSEPIWNENRFLKVSSSMKMKDLAAWTLK